MAYLWKQSAFRGLANYEVFTETVTRPSVKAGFGLQGIGTGNPGYFGTAEKTFRTPEATINGYIGVGFRSNEAHGHLLGGVKITPTNSPWTFGIQNDGHRSHPFVTRQLGGGVTGGVYLIEGKSLGIMISAAR